MGCGSSKVSRSAATAGAESSSTNNGEGHQADNRQETKRSTDIDRQLAKAASQEQTKFKLLLLGAGESGKSTILKQMRLLYGAPWTDDELRKYGVIIRSNTIVACKKLLMLIRRLQLEDQLASEPMNESLKMTPKEAYEDLHAYIIQRTKPPPSKFPEKNNNDWVGESAAAGISANVEAKLFLHKWKQIKCLWETEMVQTKCWQFRASVNLIDGHKLYLDSLDRIASPLYRPTKQDVLNARVKTTQVIVERYEIENVTFELYDVGGQRAERRKWLDCFDDMDAVIFVAAISEYDQSLAESKKTNRMFEAIEVFRSVCRNKSFKDTPMILFLNKKDIYADKIQYSHICSQQPFRDYKGPKQDFTAGAKYFINQFEECMDKSSRKDQYIHVTCATDTEQSKFVYIHLSICV